MPVPYHTTHLSPNFLSPWEIAQSWQRAEQIDINFFLDELRKKFPVIHYNNKIEVLKSNYDPEEYWILTDGMADPMFKITEDNVFGIIPDFF